MTESKVMNSITPGGRAADNSSHNRSPKKNWVEKAGGFPPYMRQIRNALVRKGKSESEATRLAWGILRNFASNKGGKYSAKVQAAAAATLAKMEAMRKKHDDLDIEYKGGPVDLVFYSNRSTPRVVKPGEESPSPKEGEGKITRRRKATDEERKKMRGGKWLRVDESGNTPSSDKYKKTKYRPNLVKEFGYVSERELKSVLDDTLLAELMDPLELKDDDMKLETKSTQTQGVAGVNVLDEEKGIVEAIVSVTGIEDNVKDVIRPGAYTKTLERRKPKGVYAHKWDMPVSKALEAKELMPGDPGLPATLPDGSPWPAEAGAFKVKAQFNLDTQQGRDAFSNVKFYGDEQEWSIGYRVPNGGATQAKGVRYIDTLDLYEYSPVLFGAMPIARTQSVKDALAAIQEKGLDIDDIETMELSEFKELLSDCGIDLDEEPEGKSDEDDFEQKDDEGVEGAEGTEQEYTGAGALDFLESFAEKVAADGFEATAYEYEWLVKAADAIGTAIEAIDVSAIAFDTEGKSDEEAVEEKTLASIVDQHEAALGEYAEELKEAALDFDYALDAEDDAAMDEAGNAVIDIIEKAQESGDDALAGAAQKVALGVASMLTDSEEESDDAAGNSGSGDSATDELEHKPSGLRTLPPRPAEKSDEVELDLKSLGALGLRVG